MSFKSLYEDQMNIDQSDEQAEPESLLLFKIGDEKFAASFSQVVEICDYTPFTVYPDNNPKHLGIINLRGTLIPIRTAFSMNLRPAEFHNGVRYIIFGHPKLGRFGILVDHVSKIAINGELLSKVPNDFHTHLVNIDGSPVRIISLEAILDTV